MRLETSPGHDDAPTFRFSLADSPRLCSTIVPAIDSPKERSRDGKFRGYPSDVYRNQGQSRKRERQRATRVNRWPIDATVCEDGNPVELSQAINAVVGPGCKLRGLLSGRAPN